MLYKVTVASFSKGRFVPGDSILIEATFRLRTPFTSWALDSPSNGVTVTITLKGASSPTVDAAAMTPSSTGKFYYQWNTTTSTAVGTYYVKIIGDDADGDAYWNDDCIQLVEAL